MKAQSRGEAWLMHFIPSYAEERERSHQTDDAFPICASLKSCVLDFPIGTQRDAIMGDYKLETLFLAWTMYIGSVLPG
jgi:hypothetical protein